MKKRSYIISALTFAFCTTLALAGGQDKVRIMRVTLQDGSTKQYMVEQLQKLTFVADKQDSSGMKERDADKKSGLPDKIDVNTQLMIGAVTISADRKTASIDGTYDKPLMTYFTEDVEVKSVTFDRKFNTTLTGNKYSTIMLPFDIALDHVSGAKFYDLAIETDPSVHIVANLKESGTLEAYRPYLLQASEENITFKGPVTFKKYARNPVVNGDWEFRGSYNYFVIGDSTHLVGKSWGYAAKDIGNVQAGQFSMFGKKGYLYPMRAYLVYNAGEPQEKSVIALKKGVGGGSVDKTIEFPETIDMEIVENGKGIEVPGSFEMNTAPFHINNWYDLQGRNVKKAPKAQGNYYNKATRKTVR